MAEQYCISLLASRKSSFWPSLQQLARDPFQEEKVAFNVFVPLAPSPPFWILSHNALGNYAAAAEVSELLVDFAAGNCKTCRFLPSCFRGVRGCLWAWGGVFPDRRKPKEFAHL